MTMLSLMERETIVENLWLLNTLERTFRRQQEGDIRGWPLLGQAGQWKTLHGFSPLVYEFFLPGQQHIRGQVLSWWKSTRLFGVKSYSCLYQQHISGTEIPKLAKDMYY